MQTGLVHLHNFLRWVILIMLLVSISRSYSGWHNRKVFSPTDKKMWLFTMIAAHITLLIGLYQWLFGRFGVLVTSLPAGTSVMKDKFFRFFWVEHPTGMIISIILITLGYGMATKAVNDQVRFKKSILVFYHSIAGHFGNCSLAFPAGYRQATFSRHALNAGFVFMWYHV